jgi:ankyrin repeat protein
MKLVSKNNIQNNQSHILSCTQDSESPLQRACYFGCSDIVSLLLKHEAKVDSKALEKAVSEGYE